MVPSEEYVAADGTTPEDAAATDIPLFMSGGSNKWPLVLAVSDEVRERYVVLAMDVVVRLVALTVKPQGRLNDRVSMKPSLVNASMAPEWSMRRGNEDAEQIPLMAMRRVQILAPVCDINREPSLYSMRAPHQLQFD
jgi:hypothetical protein